MKHYYRWVVVFHLLRNLNWNISDVGDVRESVTAALASLQTFSRRHVKIRLQRKQQRWMGWVFSSSARCFFDKMRPSYCAWWKEWRDNWKKVMELSEKDWSLKKWLAIALLSVKKTRLSYSIWRSKQDPSSNIADSAITSSMGTAES